MQSVWKFTDETVYSLLWLDGRLWVGTGLEGKLYSHQDERMMLEKDVDQSQIVALLPGEAGPAFATTNGAAFFRFTKGMERKRHAHQRRLRRRPAVRRSARCTGAASSPTAPRSASRRAAA